MVEVLFEERYLLCIPSAHGFISPRGGWKLDVMRHCRYGQWPGPENSVVGLELGILAQTTKCGPHSRRRRGARFMLLAAYNLCRAGWYSRYNMVDGDILMTSSAGTYTQEQFRSQPSQPLRPDKASPVPPSILPVRHRFIDSDRSQAGSRT